MHNSHMLQKKVFDIISRKVGKENLASTLTNHLHITKSAVYKRIRLEKTLSIDELLILTDRFELSLDHVVKECYEMKMAKLNH